eukprot:398116-Pyramimonas_sp.AAC.1
MKAKRVWKSGGCEVSVGERTPSAGEWTPSVGELIPSAGKSTPSAGKKPGGSATEIIGLVVMLDNKS